MKNQCIRTSAFLKVCESRFQLNFAQTFEHLYQFYVLRTLYDLVSIFPYVCVINYKIFDTVMKFLWIFNFRSKFIRKKSIVSCFSMKLLNARTFFCIESIVELAVIGQFQYVPFFNLFVNRNMIGRDFEHILHDLTKKNGAQNDEKLMNEKNTQLHFEHFTFRYKLHSIVDFFHFRSKSIRFFFFAIIVFQYIHTFR